jgi:hypothetical protein
VDALRAVVRIFSYLFHAVLALFLLAISVVALSSGQSLQLQMLPWQGRSLDYWLFFSALFGLITVVLAILRKWPPLFFLWSLAVFTMMVRGFFFGHYLFRGRPDVHRALLLTAGALVALFGAWFQLRRKPVKAVS